MVWIYRARDNYFKTLASPASLKSVIKNCVLVAIILLIVTKGTSKYDDTFLATSVE